MPLGDWFILGCTIVAAIAIVILVNVLKESTNRRSKRK